MVGRGFVGANKSASQPCRFKTKYTRDNIELANGNHPPGKTKPSPPPENWVITTYQPSAGDPPQSHDATSTPKIKKKKKKKEYEPKVKRFGCSAARRRIPKARDKI